MLQIDQGKRIAVVVEAVPLTRQDRPLRVTPIGRIQRLIAPKLARFDKRQRNLIGRIPVRSIEDAVEGPAPCLAAIAQAQQTIELVESFRWVPWPVLMQRLGSEQQGRRPTAEQRRVADTRLPDGSGSRDHGSRVAERPARQLGEILGEAQDIRYIDRAGNGEITIIGIVGSLAVVDGVDELRNQEIQVRIPLSVRIAGHVHWNTIDGRDQIGAVIQVVAAQEVLIRLAIPRMLGYDQAGNELEHVARTKKGSCLDYLAAHFTFGSGVRGTDQGAIPDDYQRLQ